MRAQILNSKQPDFGQYQIWKNPEDNILYGTSATPEYGFKEADAWPIYSLNTHAATLQKIAKGDSDEDSLHNAFLDTSVEEIAKEYRHDVLAGGQQKLAALRSATNSAVNILNIWTEVQGRQDRKFAGKNLAREVAVPNLLISIDKVRKFNGLTRIDEGQLGQLKELTYTRQNFSANKYGLKFVVHEEARLKNEHNLFQDSVQVAATKVDQRASYDVITVAETNTTQAVIGAWDTFVAGADRSNNSPLTDIGIAQLTIEGTSVGGSLTRVGMHQLTFAKFVENTFIRGNATATPVEYSFEPGTRSLPGISGLGLCLDQGFTQGKVSLVDNTTADANILYLQGPQRIGSAIDEETNDEKYFIIDYHNAVKAQTETGIVLTAATTPLAW